MAIFHLSTKPLSRSSGRSAVAAAAYRSGSCLSDERQGITHDYERRSGVEHAEVVTPEGAGDWERQDLWNAAEGAENRKDARTAREWEVALPEELDPLQRQELAVGFAQALTQRFGCAVDVAIHAPGKGGDSRNWHAHLLATTRQLGEAGLGDKCSIELSDKKRLSLGMGPARTEVDAVRQLWEQHTNQALERAGRPERVSSKTLEKQKEAAELRGDAKKVIEFNRAPQVKLGWKAAAMERRGVKTYRGDSLRVVKAENKQRQAELISIETLRPQFERQKALEGDFKQAVARLRVFPTKDGRLGQVRQWAHTAQMPIPTDARAAWEKSAVDVDAIGWRMASQEFARATKRFESAAKAVVDWVKAHPIRVKATGILGAPPKLRILEDEHYQADRALRSAKDELERMEHRWLAVRPDMEAQILRSADAIRDARRYTEALMEFRDRLAVMLDRDEAAREENYREKQRSHNRGRENQR